MTTCSCVGFSTMKPCSRILSSYKSSLLFGFSTTKFNDPITAKSTSIHSHSYHSCNTQIIRYIHVSVINLNWRYSFSISDSKWGPSRIFSTSCSMNIGSASHRGFPLVTNVASDIRNHSTSVDAHVS